MMEIEPGDLIFCHSHGIVGRAIRAAERIHGTPGSFYNHVAIVSEQAGGDWRVIQAEGHGVTDAGLLSSIAPGGKFTIVPCPRGVDRGAVLRFARRQVGDRYGWLTILSIVLTLYTPEFLNVMAPGTWICSALAGEALRAGGWVHNWGDVYQVRPDQLYDALL